MIMYAKKIITAVLLIFVFVSVVFLLVRELSTQQSITKSSPEILDPTQSVVSDSTFDKPETVVDTALPVKTVARVRNKIDKSEKGSSKIVIYYFHRTIRCVTCTNLEQYSDEAIRQGFGDELKTGRLEWRSINFEEPVNQHFEEDFQLHTQSLILVRIVNGKQKSWKNLEKIWELVGVKEIFMTYVQDELTEYLAENS